MKISRVIIVSLMVFCLDTVGKSLDNFCNICNKSSTFMNMKTRKNVRCPRCGSLERHRFLYHVYNDFIKPQKNKKTKILHTAPERCFIDFFKKKYIKYFPIDIAPQYYSYVKCIKEDVTDLTFKDNTFDFVLSNHVMEHVDDKKFLHEIFRVLKPGGILILTFPIFKQLNKTFSDPGIKTDKDRERFYGQKDHLRAYGKDIIETLRKDYKAEIIDYKKYVNEVEAEKKKFEGNIVL